MANIDTKYEVWKNKLLDLGRRNRLLNYKETVRSTVKIEYPDCRALWELFVKKEMPLVFPSPAYDDETEIQESNSNVRTNQNTVDLQKTLRNLRSKAKTAIEEQGVNVLYLSFGFLEWTENDSSDQVLVSPLILVPATLIVESIKSPFVLKLHEDELVVNPTLAYKLENDFGIVLPCLNEAEDLEEFFNEVKRVIGLYNWSVTENVSLSLLSFLKNNMYSDLKKHKEAIVEHPIVKAISGDASSVERIPDSLSDYDFDRNEKTVDVFQVVDADASQQDAILMAKKGYSYIIQGPPGTGKSQTITNIIAESLAEGKKVLFVSEKMAALDVVYRRLSGAGLDDFCLVLHSHKANKKNVIEQLGKVLDLSNKKATLSDEAYRKLEVLQEDKEKLNEYAKQLHETVLPIKKTIYEANGIIANLESADDLIFSVNDIRKVTEEEYNRYISVLDKYKSIVTKASDVFGNPWRNCHISCLTNEFRRDVITRLNTLIPEIEELDTAFAQSESVLYLDLPHTINDVRQIIELLECTSDAYPIPSEWLLTEDLRVLPEEIDNCSTMKAKYMSLIEKLGVQYDSIKQKEALVPVCDIGKISSLTVAREEKNSLLSFVSDNAPYKHWSEDNISNAHELLHNASDIAKQIKSYKEELLRVYEPSVFDLDYRGMLARLKTEYTSFTKYFKRSYREDKKTVMLHHRDIVKKVSDEEMFNLTDKLKKIDEYRQWYNDKHDDICKLFGELSLSEETDYADVERQISVYTDITHTCSTLDELFDIYTQVADNEEKYIKHFGFLYNGIMSDWKLIHKSLEFALEFKSKTEMIEVSKAFIEKVCECGSFISLTRQEKEKLEDKLLSISSDYSAFVSYFDYSDMFDNIVFDSLTERFSRCLNGLSLLEEWIDYNAVRSECFNAGLGEYIRIFEEHKISADKITDVFKKRFWNLWLDAVLPEYPAVMNFRRKSQESTVDEFCSLDKLQFEIAKARIKSKLVNSLPSLEHFTNGMDEISILKRELNKQRRIMPIRRLFAAIPNLLLTLKPCLMMSPLTVSLFLEAETYKFDLVIFDEASQVCTENAIGAISRARQVIIAGDTKQLPPTNFFKATVSEGDFDTDDDDGDYYEAGAYESIMDEANMLPEQTLRWHYRSRHESLIAFSNAKIYRNNLVTFPSNIQKAENIGVEYVYVKNGYYDRGGKKGNVPEANTVADLVFKHIQEQPNRSLGVIAFGEIQQQAIEAVIRERRMQNQQYESFFSEDKDEAFFVKNLENVQGDERDTIIFSIGYAKDSQGVFRMNFGPLSKSGGERRLNVAITRAKYNIKLVGSILPSDILIDKINVEGPKLLHDYIDYAMNGQIALEKDTQKNTAICFDSTFEEAVYTFLESKGYMLETQVGCSGYRIDIAVLHPTIKGRFVLGIECDGESYHCARTARERDRLRQDVLENMGWNIYHVWSSDWIKDPQYEGSKLIEVIEQTIADCSGDDDKDCFDMPDENADNADDFVSMEDKELSSEDSNNPYGFERALDVDFTSLFHNQFGYPDLTDCIMEVVNKEYPVHYELLCQKLASLFGNEKATIKIRREVDYGLLRLNNRIIRRGEYIYPSGYETIPVRMPNKRKIQHISKEELSEAMYRILQTCVGTTRDGLISETARVYGFSRIGQNILTAMNDSVDYMIQTERALEIEGKLRISGKN